MHSFIDTHAHLYATEFNDDRNEMVQRAIARKVTKMLLPNIDVSSVAGMHELVTSFPQNCFAAIGLHPCSVNALYKNDLKALYKHFAANEYYAVGEIGLDYYWDKTYVGEQKRAFVEQIEWAKELSLPIIIHTRNSFDDAIEIVEEQQDGRLSGVFHCFGGTIEEGKRIKDIGFYMGIGGVATFKKSNHLQVLPVLGMDKIVLETDAPYLTPVPYRGKRNESSYIPYIAEKTSVHL